MRKLRTRLEATNSDEFFDTVYRRYSNERIPLATIIKQEAIAAGIPSPSSGWFYYQLKKRKEAKK